MTKEQGSKKKKKKRRLNEGLCPEEFKICVPKTCGLLEAWDTPDKWSGYLRTLTSDAELLEPYVVESQENDYEESQRQAEPGRRKSDPCPPVPAKPPTCWTCDCKEGWELRGELAIRHACRVHDKIHRQVLGFEQVSAVDVGFAIWERQTRFGDFLAIRIHVNKKRPPEQLFRAGLESFTPPYYAFSQPMLSSLRKGRLVLEAFEGRGALPRQDAPEPPFDEEHRCCPHPERWANLIEVLSRELEDDQRGVEKAFGRYPVSGVRREDLSIFCPLKIAETTTLDDIRLCICGVPIDIVNAEYRPSTFHPGGDAESGLFVDRPKGSVELEDDEQLLTGRGRVNPLVGGVSVGSVTGQAGTLGAIVWDRTDGTPCVLSNWHVLAGTATAQVGQPTYQPALFDGGTEEDVIAHLKRWRLSEDGDAAIAELTGQRNYASGEVLGLWHPIAGYLEPRLNLEIRKWGRSSGFTQGFIDGIHLATNIDYGNGVVRYFRDQFHVAPLFAGQDVSQVGDSGSLVVTSVRPLDLQRDLDQLCTWFRECCGQGRSVLCAEIEKRLPCLKKECQELAQSHCSGLCAYLDCLEIIPCEDLSSEDLCEKIGEARDYLRERCKQYSRCSKCYLYLEAQLDRLVEECCDCHYSSEDIWQELCRIVKNAHEECTKKECTKLPKMLEELCGKYERAEADIETCADLAVKLRELKAEFGEFRKCARFCGRVAECFEDWAGRCASIPQAEKRCQQICQALIDEAKCRDKTCKSPGALIRCIEEQLREETTPGSQGPDQVLEALGSSLGLSGRELREILQVTARDFREKRENEEDRRRIRSYFAVGLIFAGDTPGSPFGEFAVASEISRLAEELRFSLRPVFEPRSSFRELRVRPQQGRAGRRALRSGTALTPGAQGDDPRGGGPQPDLEPAQPSSSSRTGGGGG